MKESRNDKSGNDGDRSIYGKQDEDENACGDSSGSSGNDYKMCLEFKPRCALLIANRKILLFHHSREKQKHDITLLTEK